MTASLLALFLPLAARTAPLGRSPAELIDAVASDQRLGQARPLAVGFRYVHDAASRQFAHAPGLVVLTADGRVSQYLLGVEFEARSLRLALVEASAGRLGSLIDRAILLCYQYDPESGRYGFALLR